MKKKGLKRLSILALAVTLSASNVIPVYAESLLDTIDSTETDKDFAEDTSYSRFRGNNLNFGTVSIGKLSSMEIAIDGTTQCHHECDKVYLDLYLERKVDGVYSTYKY